MTKLDVVIPGLNEEKGLENTVSTLSEFMYGNMDGYDWRIVIADNGSTDATPEIGRRLASERERVEYLRLEQRGRGTGAEARMDAERGGRCVVYGHGPVHGPGVSADAGGGGG